MQLLSSFLKSSTTPCLAQDWPDANKQQQAVQGISAEAYQRVSQISKEEYDDIPKPTVLQLFQVSWVEIECQAGCGKLFAG